MLTEPLLNVVSSIYTLSQGLRDADIQEANKTRARSTIHSLSKMIEPEAVAALATAYGYLWFGLQQLEKSWEVNRAVIKEAMRDAEAESRWNDVTPLQTRLTVLATLLQQISSIKQLGRLPGPGGRSS